MSENPGVYIAMTSAVLVTTKGYRVLVTTIESQNAFAPSLRSRTFHMTVKARMMRLRVIESPNLIIHMIKL